MGRGADAVGDGELDLYKLDKFDSEFFLFRFTTFALTTAFTTLC